MAASTFSNDAVGGTTLVRPAIQSPNYKHGVSGWAVFQDGTAEFNSLVIRGTINGVDYIINNNGIFFYSS